MSLEQNYVMSLDLDPNLFAAAIEAIATDYAAVSNRMRVHFADLLTGVEDPTERRATPSTA